ncbi:hypothetical protein DFH27DRAFT_561984 [Peziza echinospora]|nr:hypothetical protein DFH27DRAFT_561984 [Peziza echinospora]
MQPPALHPPSSAAIGCHIPRPPHDPANRSSCTSSVSRFLALSTQRPPRLPTDCLTGISRPQQADHDHQRLLARDALSGELLARSIQALIWPGHSSQDTPPVKEASKTSSPVQRHVCGGTILQRTPTPPHLSHSHDLEKETLGISGCLMQGGLGREIDSTPSFHTPPTANAFTCTEYAAPDAAVAQIVSILTRLGLHWGFSVIIARISMYLTLLYVGISCSDD